jgi:hypothetical protein
LLLTEILRGGYRYGHFATAVYSGFKYTSVIGDKVLLDIGRQG